MVDHPNDGQSHGKDMEDEVGTCIIGNGVLDFWYSAAMKAFRMQGRVANGFLGYKRRLYLIQVLRVGPDCTTLLRSIPTT